MEQLTTFARKLLISQTWNSSFLLDKYGMVCCVPDYSNNMIIDIIVFTQRRR